jgi:two-component system, OmpR family, response regulator ChvI
MGRVEARLGRNYRLVGNLDPMPVTLAPVDGEGFFNHKESDRLSPSRSAAQAAINDEPRRVVLVESDQYYREVLTFELLCQGFLVHAFADGAALLGSLATAAGADLAVLDWDLPAMPGTTLMAQLRRQGVDIPVVFLAGKIVAGEQHERVLLASREALNTYEYTAFDQGAVDFVAKSRDRKVLVRRLKSVIERAKPTANVAVEERLACGKLLLKPESRRACWNHVDVGLTLGEYNIVHSLASNVGSFITYREVYDRLTYKGFIAGTGPDGYRGNVRSAIKRIRNKFRGLDPTFEEIETFTGVGYSWRKPSF